MVESDLSNSDKPNLEAEDNSIDGPTELEAKIIRQIEYYFGDFNLVKDKFLQEQIKLDDGWVPLATLLTFHRLANLSKDSKVILDALEKATSGLIEINDTKEKIRRSPYLPLPEMNEHRRKELMERTVYCKGFPCDSQLNDLLEFFHTYGDIENVAMRSWNDKATHEWKFKGSVFVIFKTVEGADKFLKVESIKYKDQELIKKWQKDYLEEKRKERLESRMKHGKKSKAQDNKKVKSESDKGDNKADNDSNDEDDDQESDGFATGTVVELSGLNSEVKWMSIKERIEEMGLAVAFIEYNSGDEVAFVRLANKDTASELAELVEKEDNKKLKIGSNELSLRVVEGEEEAIFLEKQKTAVMKRRHIVNKRRNMGKKGRGGRGRNRGKWDSRKRRGSSPATGEPPVKVQAN